MCNSSTCSGVIPFILWNLWLPCDLRFLLLAAWVRPFHNCYMCRFWWRLPNSTQHVHCLRWQFFFLVVRLLGVLATSFICGLLDSLKSWISTSRMLDTLYPPLFFLGASCADSRACFCTSFDFGLYHLFGCTSPLQLRRRLTEVDALHLLTAFLSFVVPLTCV